MVKETKLKVDEMKKILQFLKYQHVLLIYYFILNQGEFLYQFLLNYEY